MIEDDDIETPEGVEIKLKDNRKKILIFILPALIVIGISVGLYHAITKDYKKSENSYSIVTQPNASDDGEKVTILYDLPEISAAMQSIGPDTERLNLSLNIELSNVEDIPTIEQLSPRIKDAVLSHVVALEPQEVENSNGLYWLKEELLYRINLIVSPIKIDNLNIKALDFQKSEN